MKALLELGVELRSRLGNTVGADDLTVQVRQRSPDDDGDDREGNEQHAVHTGVEQVRKDVVDVKD